MNRRASDVKQKILFVSEKGFSGLDELVREKIANAVKAKGWRIERIADSKIETFGDLIDRLR